MKKNIQYYFLKLVQHSILLADDQCSSYSYMYVVKVKINVSILLHIF